MYQHVWRAVFHDLKDNVSDLISDPSKIRPGIIDFESDVWIKKARLSSLLADPILFSLNSSPDPHSEGTTHQLLLAMSA